MAFCTPQEMHAPGALNMLILLMLLIVADVAKAELVTIGGLAQAVLDDTEADTVVSEPPAGGGGLFLQDAGASTSESITEGSRRLQGANSHRDILDGNTAQVTIVADDSHTSFCNGQLMGSAASWNTPNTWPCSSTDGTYVVAVDAQDGEIAVGSGIGGIMASIIVDDGRELNSGPTWRCWVPDGHAEEIGNGEPPPEGWNQPGFDDSSWPKAVSYGLNTDPHTHWYQYIKPNGRDTIGQRGGNRNGLAGGEYDPTCDTCVGAFGGGITDKAGWIWTSLLDLHNDVFCRGTLAAPRRLGMATCQAGVQNLEGSAKHAVLHAGSMSLLNPWRTHRTAVGIQYHVEE
jgi:hypothetical protein